MVLFPIIVRYGNQSIKMGNMGSKARRKEKKSIHGLSFRKPFILHVDKAEKMSAFDRHEMH